MHILRHECIDTSLIVTAVHILFHYVYRAESQASQYISYSVTFMECATSVQCFSLIGGNCTLQYTTTSGTGVVSGQGVNTTFLLLSGMANAFTATVLSDILRVTNDITRSLMSGAGKQVHTNIH